MNKRSDIDRVLELWMADGPTAMPDRIVDVVAHRISDQRQRRMWRLLRRLPVNQIIKLGAAAAAVLVITVIGYNLLPGQPGAGGQPSPTPTAQPSPLPSATGAAVLDLPNGQLSAGRYRFQPLSEPSGFAVLADIPAGWYGLGRWAALGPTSEEPPNGIAFVMLAAEGLFRDPCHWDLAGSGSPDQPGDVEVGPTALDLVEAIQANSAYTSTAPSPVTFGEYEGYEIEIQLPADLGLATCDKFDGAGRYFMFAGRDAGVYAQGNGTDLDRWHLRIVDVDRVRVIVSVLSYPETPTADLDAAQAIVDSVEFVP